MLYFLYSLEPFVMLRYDISSGSLDFVDPRYAEYSRSSFTFLAGGSASCITLDNRQLLILHRRTVRLPRLRYIYVHRCATLNPSLTKLEFGCYFVIGRAEPQFVAGMNVDNDIVRLSYGAAGSIRLSSRIRSRDVHADFRPGCLRLPLEGSWW